jgi:drug/metabolite transporter (DMT)-like permease
MEGESTPLLPFPPLPHHLPTFHCFKIFCLTIGLAVAGCCQTVILPLWTTTLGKSFDGSYFILLINSLLDIVFFGSFAVIVYIILRPSTPRLSVHWKIFVPLGVSNGLSEILILYSSPTTRTPPLLQKFLLNIPIVFSIVSTKMFISEKKEWKYAQISPIVAVIVLLLGTMILIFPQFLNVIHGTSFFWKDEGGLVWACVMLLGLFFVAIYNVLQELFLIKRLRESRMSTQTSKVYDLLMMLLWSGIFQMATISFFFWVNTIPKFGSFPSLQMFFDSLVYFLRCIATCPQNWTLGLLFNVSVVIANFTAAWLNEESANYTMIAATLPYPLALIFWFFFPQFKTSSAPKTIPLWSAIPSFVLLVLSCVIWKIWEYREANRLRRIYELRFQINVGAVDTLVQFPQNLNTNSSSYENQSK